MSLSVTRNLDSFHFIEDTFFMHALQSWEVVAEDM